MNTFSASGQRAYDNTYLLDGADNNTMQRASQGRRAEVVKPSIDAVQEFKVLTNAYSAEFGRAGGGVISLSIKSGSNALHGTVFEFLRNDKLDAKNFFDLTKPSFKRNQYGFSVGGPIKKDKTFFFVRLRKHARSASRGLCSAPSRRLAKRRAISANCCRARSCTIRNSYNAATKLRSSASQITWCPPSEIDPIGVKLISFYPKANLPGLSRNFLFNPPGPDDIAPRGYTHRSQFER